MPDLETCRRNILSEDYRDFIENRTRTPLFNELLLQNPCEQDAGSGYTCYYFPKESVEPITLSRFSYNSIPQCFSPLSMETLNQAGILPVQNYPTLQLKGQGVLIGFLDSGIDYTSRLFRNLDGSTSRAERPRRDLLTERNIPGKLSMPPFLLKILHLLFLPLMTPDTGLLLPASPQAVQISPNSFSEPPLNVPLQW